MCGKISRKNFKNCILKSNYNKIKLIVLLQRRTKKVKTRKKRQKKISKN